MTNLNIPINESYHINIDAEDELSVKLHKWSVCGSYPHQSVGRNIQVSGSGAQRKTMWQSLAQYLLNTESVVDHIDRNPFNNCKDNLRICTVHQNTFNRAKYRGNPTSKYKGVSWNAKHKRWYAFIRFNGKRIYLGNFEVEANAARAYNDAAMQFFKEFAYLNQI